MSQCPYSLRSSTRRGPTPNRFLALEDESDSLIPSQELASADGCSPSYFSSEDTPSTILCSPSSFSSIGTSATILCSSSSLSQEDAPPGETGNAPLTIPWAFRINGKLIEDGIQEVPGLGNCFYDSLFLSLQAGALNCEHLGSKLPESALTLKAKIVEFALQNREQMVFLDHTLLQACEISHGATRNGQSAFSYESHWENLSGPFVWADDSVAIAASMFLDASVVVWTQEEKGDTIYVRRAFHPFSSSFENRPQLHIVVSGTTRRALQLGGRLLIRDPRGADRFDCKWGPGG